MELFPFTLKFTLVNKLRCTQDQGLCEHTTHLAFDFNWTTPFINLSV